MSNKQIDALLDSWSDMKRKRYNFERDWQDIVDYVRPNTTDPVSKQYLGEERTREIYDSTALESNLQLASGLHSYLTNPAERWFSIGVRGVPNEQLDHNALAWLEVVSDIIFSQYQLPESGFNVAMHESYLDIGAFGTCCPYQWWNSAEGHLAFRSFPIADVWFRENSGGQVDTVARKVMWSGRQLMQEFGQLPPKIMHIAEKKPNDKTEAVHLVTPRSDREINKFGPKSMAFGSYWISTETNELLNESGFNDLPYHPARWLKLPDEVYGRGPAHNCLPDIRMLQAMEKILIKAGSKAVDPPLILPDEGYITPIETESGALIWKEPDAEKVEALRHEGNLPWGLEHAEQKRDHIRICFHADWLRLEKANKEMTAFEVSDRRNEKLGLLAPMLGRIQSEKLGTMLGRSFRLLDERNYLPPAPPSLQGRQLEVTYISPAARAQTSAKAAEMGRFTQEIIPLAQLDPTVLDAVNLDMYAIKLAEYRGSPRGIMRSPEEIAAIRQQRQEQQQAAAMLQAAEPASKAIKNIADANESGGAPFTV